MATTAITERQRSIIALNEKLRLLVKRGEGIEVKDASGDLQAKQFEVEVKSYRSAVDLFTGAEIAEAKERLSRLILEKNLLLAPLNEVYESVRRLRKAWEEAERQAAEKESAKLAKKGEAVSVKPSIPTLPGVQSRRNWKWTVKDVSKMKREYLMPDFSKIGLKVRELKDKDKAEKAIGGIEVFTE